MNNVHFSSKTDLWETPQELFDRLDAIHHFTLDVCATKENAKCARYFTSEQDGLKQHWGNDICWMNPPYGRAIGDWIAKAAHAGRSGGKVVCLLPARTDTAWWHDYVIPYGKIEFLRGRLKFGGHKNSAPFPSAVVIFNKPTENLCP